MKQLQVLTGVMLLGAASGAAAQADQRLVVPLSDPAAPATLEVSLISGSVSVNAYDGSDVVVVVGGTEEPERAPRADEQGLHRIPNTAFGVTAEEHDDTVSVSMDTTSRAVALEISVPRRTSVRASVVNGGDVTVTGVSGDHELSNVNGSIVATDISGSAVANTTNGNVRISFAEVASGKAMSFSSFNGDVDVTFPASLAADLRIDAGRGDILTDFDAAIQPAAPVVDRSGGAGRYRVRLERDVHAVVGGGGPELQFKTFNGDIRIRRR
jgi:DUF4097 and DUF4098 domain-containing protein YvlB